jgi:dihydroorotate dehydrogenase electron transfer subunit
MFNELRIVKLESIMQETPTVKSFYFYDKFCMDAQPGQFVMLWIPGVDEIPLSISSISSDGVVSVSVKRVGEATEALHRKTRGTYIGVRGPFGNGFKLSAGNILIIGGGTGLAPLSFLAEKLVHKQPRKITFLLGAKTKRELIFYERIKKTLSKLDASMLTFTEDGSYGTKGLVTDQLQQLFHTEKFDMVYACGPEAMIKKVFEHTENYGVTLQASLERLMRCAIGICATCDIGGYRVCTDGPVFVSEQLRKMQNELGLFKRDFNGKKIPLNQ